MALTQKPLPVRCSARGAGVKPDLLRSLPPTSNVPASVFGTFQTRAAFHRAFFHGHHHSVTESHYLALLTLREAGESRQIAFHPWFPLTLKSACRALRHLFFSG
ncbi:hypothetical protein AGR5A_Cc90111 [Agrobacterium genomosp. 5 str. CFBP 6626]|nr:hypothetical protein AGR5A_Cc90111 [Agrobacterium genomosp. 5 str. CFBP 6626]